MNSKIKAFTLIELLIVIAIIGLLATIVFASLTSAKSKAKDVRIQGDLASVRKIADLIYGDASPNAYTALCPSGGVYNTFNPSAPAPYLDQLTALEADIKTTNGGTGMICFAFNEKFCVSINLNLGGKKYCIDYMGKTGDYTCTITPLGGYQGRCM